MLTSLYKHVLQHWALFLNKVMNLQQTFAWCLFLLRSWLFKPTWWARMSPLPGSTRCTLPLSKHTISNFIFLSDTICMVSQPLTGWPCSEVSLVQIILFAKGGNKPCTLCLCFFCFLVVRRITPFWNLIWRIFWIKILKKRWYPLAFCVFHSNTS